MDVLSDCGLCQKMKAAPEPPVFENELWQVRAVEPPCIPGWMMLLARRHAAGLPGLNDAEAASLGWTLRHLQRVLLEVTGALRIYSASLGEREPHFHVHLVPRYREMPRDAKGWAVFDLQRAFSAGELELPAAEITRISDAYRKALSDHPPPR